MDNKIWKLWIPSMVIFLKIDVYGQSEFLLHSVQNIDESSQNNSHLDNAYRHRRFLEVEKRVILGV